MHDGAFVEKKAEVMVYAPIIIPTLCRSVHFKRCVESLKKNTWAKFTDVYVGLDYPAKEDHWKGYNEICDYLETGDFSCFKSFHVIKRDHNLGPGPNSADLRKIATEHSDCFIRTDDDIEFSPNFIEFMDKGLELSREDENIIAVSGYSCPVDWEVSEGSNCFLQNVSAPMWGTGFWKGRFEEFSKEVKSGRLIENFPTAVRQRKSKEMIPRAWEEYVGMVAFPYPEKTLIYSASDVSLRIYLALFDKFVLMPTVSKTRNWGFDGSGVWCKRDERIANGEVPPQIIDLDTDFELHLDTKKALAENRKRYSKVDCCEKNAVKSKAKEIVYLLLGDRLYRKIIGPIFDYFICKQNKNETR